jgi:hypothetical protein
VVFFEADSDRINTEGRIMEIAGPSSPRNSPNGIEEKEGRGHTFRMTFGSRALHVTQEMPAILTLGQFSAVNASVGIDSRFPVI